jgi:hypothetical protein
MCFLTINNFHLFDYQTFDLKDVFNFSKMFFIRSEVECFPKLALNRLSPLMIGRFPKGDTFFLVFSTNFGQKQSQIGWVFLSALNLPSPGDLAGWAWNPNLILAPNRLKQPDTTSKQL